MNALSVAFSSVCALFYAAYYVAPWFQASKCICDCTGAGPDPELLRLVQSQLDRCGPAQLQPLEKVELWPPLWLVILPWLLLVGAGLFGCRRPLLRGLAPISEVSALTSFSTPRVTSFELFSGSRAIEPEPLALADFRDAPRWAPPAGSRSRGIRG